jgi:DNA polymerase-1
VTCRATARPTTAATASWDDHRPVRHYLPPMTDADTTALPAADRPLTQDGPPVRLYLIDGSGYIFRAYHALPPLTRKSDGLPVGAVQGFCNMLFKLLRDMKEDGPTHLAVIFDHSEKTFRNTLYDQYKATARRCPRT